MLLTGGRRGTEDNAFAVAAAVLIDAALSGVIDVRGRRRLGFDRRRVVPGPARPDPSAEPLMADLRRQVETAAPDSPLGWCAHLMAWAEDAVTDELVSIGLVRVLPVPWWKRVLRHRTLEVVDPGTVEEIRARLEAIRSGRSGGRAHDVALGVVLRETDLLSGTFGRGSRRLARALDREVRTLPPAARAIADTLSERSARQDRIGTWYADD
jgi:hypothetical protein